MKGHSRPPAVIGTDAFSGKIPVASPGTLSGLWKLSRGVGPERLNRRSDETIPSSSQYSAPGPISLDLHLHTPNLTSSPPATPVTFSQAEPLDNEENDNRKHNYYRVAPTGACPLGSSGKKGGMRAMARARWTKQKAAVLAAVKGANHHP